MTLGYKKAAYAMLWVCLVFAAGLVAQLVSRSAWTVVAALAIFPPLVMMRYWKDPDQSMSESIRNVLQ